MSATHRTLGGTNTTYGVQQGARTAGLVGLVARGALYLALAVLALELVFGDRSESADPRGAMHDLAHTGFGVFVLVILVSRLRTVRAPAPLPRDQNPDNKTSRRVNDCFWAVVNGFLAVLAASFLFTSKSSGDTDQTDKTFTAKVMDMSGGRLLVGVVGLAHPRIRRLSRLACVLRRPSGRAGRARSSPERDAHGARPVQDRQRRRGAILGFIGVLVLTAAIQHDPNETEGLDGALKRLLDHGWGEVAVFLIALGFAAFGVYSIARAWVNREHASPSSH